MVVEWAVKQEDAVEPWRTGLVDSKDGQIRLRGYDVTSLMTRASFTDTIFLLHRGEIGRASCRERV